MTEKRKIQKSELLSLAVVGIVLSMSSLAWSQSDDNIYNPPLCSEHPMRKDCVGPGPSKLFPFPKDECLINPQLQQCVGPIDEYPSKDPKFWEEPKFFAGEIHLHCDLVFKSGMEASFKVETKYFKLQKFQMSPSDLGLILDSDMESSNCRIFRVY